MAIGGIWIKLKFLFILNLLSPINKTNALLSCSSSKKSSKYFDKTVALLQHKFQFSKKLLYLGDTLAFCRTLWQGWIFLLAFLIIFWIVPLRQNLLEPLMKPIVMWWYCFVVEHRMLFVFCCSFWGASDFFSLSCNLRSAKHFQIRNFSRVCSFPPLTPSS